MNLNILYVFQSIKIVVLSDVQIVPYWPMGDSSSQLLCPSDMTLTVFDIFLATWDENMLILYVYWYFPRPTQLLLLLHSLLLLFVSFKK